MLDDYHPDFAFLTALVSEALHERDKEDDDDKKEVTPRTRQLPNREGEAKPYVRRLPS